MLFKPSPRTVTLMKRGNWLFFPVWLGILAYIWLSAEGAIPRAWAQIIVPLFVVLVAANFVYALVALNSAHQDSKKSQHPDPDVAALIDGEIDIAEYGRRRSKAPRDSPSPLHEATTESNTAAPSTRATQGDA